MTSRTIQITHHEASATDGTGRVRRAEWRLWAPGFATSYFPHDGTDEGRREAHARAIQAARAAQNA